MTSLKFRAADDAPARLRELEQRLADATASIQAAEATIGSIDSTLQAKLAALDDEISALNDEISALNDEISRLAECNREAEAALESQGAQTRYWQTKAHELEAAVSALKSSRSWRVTAPLRALGTAARATQDRVLFRQLAGRVARFLYRKAPIGEANRQLLKRRIFESFPSVFQGTGAYQKWKQFQAEGQALAVYRVDSAGAPPTPGPPLESAPTGRPDAAPAARLRQSARRIENPPLPNADGRWEWTDYAAVMQRTLAGLQARAASSQTRPLPILDFKADDLPGEIARLAFEAVDQPSVSILIPTYNNLKYTVECLASLMRSPVDASFEVVVADDASADGTASRLSQVPHLRVLPAAENRGFLLNVNRALPELRGRFVVLLNNDVQVVPGWLDAMVSAIESSSDVGAVGPKIVYPSGVLQEAGCTLLPDGTAEMVGLGEDPDLPQFNYRRTVDYSSGACLLLRTQVLRELGGFDESFAPAYCEDSDLCLRLRRNGLRTLYEPSAVVIHHLSVTTAAHGKSEKLHQVARNLVRLNHKWGDFLDRLSDVRLIAFYLPQYHPIPENDLWWGAGFTEWRNVGKATPNFVGHYQPRIPADLGYYDLRVPEIMEQQADLAKRYGIFGFCFYYYWFAGRRLLEMPIERLLATGRPDIPFCLCWANENWTRRWDGQEKDVLMAQSHSYQDDEAVIQDLMRYMRHPNYIRVNGRPLLVVYRVTLFPDFARTAAHWRETCRRAGLGEIYLALVESFDMVFAAVDPSTYGCDAVVEFPPHGMAEPRPLGTPKLNPAFDGHVADYRDVAVRYCLRPPASHVRFRGLMPGWDNTARRQDHSWCFDHSTPGAFQAWAEHVMQQTRTMNSGEERIVFVNAWNEWAEGAYLEPDRRFGHSYLEAIRNAKDSSLLKRRHRYSLG